MKITITDIKTNERTALCNVADVKPRGLYFEVVYEDNTVQKYSFKDHDVFQERTR